MCNCFKEVHKEFGEADNSPKTFFFAVLLILSFMKYAVEAIVLNYYASMLYTSIKCPIPAIINYCFSRPITDIGLYFYFILVGFFVFSFFLVLVVLVSLSFIYLMSVYVYFISSNENDLLVFAL